MNPFHKKLVETYVGKPFRTMVDVLNSDNTVCESCEVTVEDINEIYQFAESARCDIYSRRRCYIEYKLHDSQNLRSLSIKDTPESPFVFPRP